MIHYLENKAIDYEKWDYCIANSSNRLIYAFSWYLDVVCDDWDALVLNDYEAVFPLPKRKKWGIQYVYQPFFCQQLGVFSPLDTQTLVSDFLEAIPKHFRYVDYNLNVANGIPSSTYQKNVNYELDLSVGYEELAGKFSKSNRKNIQKAEGLSFVLSEDIANFMKVKRVLASDHMDEEQFSVLEKCLLLFKAKNKLLIYQAKEATNVLAEIVLLQDEKRLLLLSSYSSREGRSLGAFFGLLSSIFKNYQNQKIIFDFEGSNLLGVAKRNKGFGADKSTYASIKLNRLPIILRWLK